MNSLERKGTGKTARACVPRPPRPADVDPQVWDDWLALRTEKRAPVTATVLNEARRQAVKAGLSLERFLAIWCTRGSQGLDASWLSADERGDALLSAESLRERDERLAAEEVARWGGPRLAARRGSAAYGTVIDLAEEVRDAVIAARPG